MVSKHKMPKMVPSDDHPPVLDDLERFFARKSSKHQNTRENFQNSAREQKFLPDQKNTKIIKYRFLGHFSFSRVKKKNWELRV